MTWLISSGATAAAASSHEHELSLPRAFWLLSRLRFTRWKNRTRQAFGRFAPPAAAGARSRTATVRDGAGVGLVLWFGVPVALICRRTSQFFEGLVREHGALALQSRAALFSSLLVSCVLMVALLGSRGWEPQERDDVEWLSTLPAPAWVLHAARLAEGAVLNPTGWLLLFPFFTGLGVQMGLGLMAPLVALGVCLPLFLFHALLGNLIDLAHLTLSRSRVFRTVRFVGPVLGGMIFIVWCAALTLDGLNKRIGLGWAKVGVLGDWLHFSSEIVWLPFSEPARALVALPESPFRALGWLGLFAAEMATVLCLGMLGLRKLYRADLVLGRDARRGARELLPAHARSARQRSFGGLLGTVVTKEWLWLRRNPARSGRILLNVVLLNAGAVLVVSRAPGVDAAALPGLALFGVGVLLLLSLAILLELEQPALWQWAALPRPISWLLARKTLFIAGLAIAGALPIVVYTSGSLPRFGQAVPALLYGATCVVILAIFQTALWLRRVSPSAATTPLWHAVRVLQLCFVAGVLATGFSFLHKPAIFVPRLAIVAAFAFTFWRVSVQRVPFVLDPSATEPATLTSTYALATILVTRILQVQLLGALTRRGMPPSRAVALSLLVAAVVVLTPSLLWLKYRGVTGLRERLGLVPGRGLLVILREGLLWSVPATAINLGYWALFGRWLAESTDPASHQQPMMTLLAGSALAVVGVGCVAAPLIEELLFRGMLYRSLRSGWGIALSLLLSTLVFAADHSLLAAVPVFCGGLCMTLAFERSRSLYAAMLTHAAYNGFIAWMMLSR